MRRTQKALIAAATAGTMMLALGGCAGSAAEKDDDGRIVVTFWHSMRANNGEQLQKYIDEFNDSQDKIYVDASEQGMYGEAYTKVMQVVGTEDAPDLMQMGNLRETMDADMITPMQDFIDADDDFDEDALLDAARGTYSADGRLQYMPQAASNNVVFYNVDAFRQAGLDPDKPLKTYAEFENAARVLKQKLGMDQGAAFLIEGGAFSSLMSVQGEPVVNNGNGREDTPTEAVFNDKAGVETMTWLKSMYDEGVIGNYGRAYDDMRQPWYSQKIGMIVDTTAATMMHSQAAEFEFNSMPMPVPEGITPGAASLGGAGLAIFSDSPDETQQAAYEFVKFLVSPEIQARWAASTGYFPVVQTAYDEQILIDAMAKSPALASANKQAREAGDDVGSLGALSGVSPNNYIADAWEAVYNGGDPQAELDKAADLVTDALESYNGVN
ncbi:ABC transporter substrate-binding protein [Microbacterium sp. KUDC0406]|uniref:ABC transporter substrate-binding protein n=1 Tax=Microbacterium sp. KUDC0406 TaxID=2909588 RepID=UPI001F28D692|nr:ABC transporter substrate-binding protein [Microbacterium sp. KUDC0406]UJP09591.1 ABC transporter substrate-binding protein [Microbacterium sp. KUDC0406]